MHSLRRSPGPGPNPFPSPARPAAGHPWNRARLLRSGLGPGRRLLTALLAAALIFVLPAAPGAAQALAELAPVGVGVFLMGGLNAAPLEVGGVLTTSLLSTSLSLVQGGSEDLTRIAVATGPHLTAGPLRLFGRVGGGYEWAGSQGRFVVRMTYGGELALTDSVLLVVQGGTSLASSSEGWSRSPDSTLSLGVELFFGPPQSQVRRERLMEAHSDWPPELADRVAGGEIDEELAAAHYPDWSVEELRLVSQGRVALGMTPEMVEAVLGRPDQVEEVQDPQLGPVQVWRYYETVGTYDPFTDKPSYREELRRTLVFQAGVVARLESGSPMR